MKPNPWRVSEADPLSKQPASGPCSLIYLKSFFHATLAFGALLHLVAFGPAELHAQTDGATELPPVSKPLQKAEIAPTVIEYPETKDTLRPVNKVIFGFNHFVNRFAITPLSKGYKKVVPQNVRTSIGNVFDTVEAPLEALHHGLQGKGKRSLQSLQRCGINLTFGVAGIFDPATQKFGIQKSDTDFDETLRHFGMQRGPYLVIPFLGSSDCRDLFGTIGDSILSPLSLFDRPLATQLKIGDAFQENAPLAENYMELYRETEEPYRFFRNLYEQGQRRDEDYPASPPQP